MRLLEIEFPQSLFNDMFDPIQAMDGRSDVIVYVVHLREALHWWESIICTQILASASSQLAKYHFFGASTVSTLCAFTLKYQTQSQNRAI